MNKCLGCRKSVINKYCSVSCQNKHMGYLKANNKYGIIKEFKVKCNCCGCEIKISEREKIFPKKERYFCSRSCSNKRKHSNETKEKIANSLKKNLSIQKRVNERKIALSKNCLQCNKETINIKFCSKRCSAIWKNINLKIGRKGGLASVKSQSESRRSKNEILVNYVCKNFNQLNLTNKYLMDGMLM